MRVGPGADAAYLGRKTLAKIAKIAKEEQAIRKL
jgi:hypothetical protein